ncbi:hypothetical protein SAY87_001973 [Trapa incisa]|uniref:IST1-like protein n=1 Tax=Trapa incisa TaxID=236973 RepID=A0AAN7JW03_9MYRT|nr:hypothetical protein SAY87_001973 [Trapa incisa]
MSVLDSFFNKGFRAAKCKTLLKLTIPRIKLLRNRREIQIKQMRRDIAKLLETGQEATARIRVEHIIREEKMMQAQEILELFCELIAVRLPIIEVQRECPIDLKEAISSVCFAAPRCADLPELIQVQMSFASKYGKEFIAAATELMPDCGVNRQLIELLSVRAPLPVTKLKLLKEIAEEHELDWDPAASETELFKSPEDLLNGSTQYVSGSKLPLPKEKHDESLYSSSQPANTTHDTDEEFDSLDFPEVPKISVRPSQDTVSAPEILPSISRCDHEDADIFEETEETLLQEKHSELGKLPLDEAADYGKADIVKNDDKQFLPFISPPSLSSGSFSMKKEALQPSIPSINQTRSEMSNDDLQDVLAAAQTAAETAERAAAAARSAASLAQVRISELTKKNSIWMESAGDNPFHRDNPDKKSDDTLSSKFGHQISFDTLHPNDSHPIYGDEHEEGIFDAPPVGTVKLDADSSSNLQPLRSSSMEDHQPLRSYSLEDDSFFSYTNLFSSSHSSNLGAGTHLSTEDSRSSHNH